MLQFSFDDLQGLIATMGGIEQILAREIAKRMQASVDAFQQAVQVETPVGATGGARGSITQYLEGSPLDLTGVVTMGVLYGEPLEYGRAPGRMPPPAALELWVTRKLGLVGKEMEQVAFLIARAIGRRGTQPGARMFERGYNNAHGAVERLWDDLPTVVVEGL